MGGGGLTWGRYGNRCWVLAGQKLVPECAQTRPSPAASAAPSTNAANTNATTGAGSRAAAAGAGGSGRTALPGRLLDGPMGMCARLRPGPGPRCIFHPSSRAACELTRGWTRYCDHDGLRQSVQVGAVGTKVLTAARACLILRQTLGWEGRNQASGPPELLKWT